MSHQRRLQFKKVSEYDLSDLDKLVGPDQAHLVKADLAENEQTGTVNLKSKTKRNRKYKGVTQFWSNYIASNTPIEDRRVGLRNMVTKQSSRSNHVRKITSEEESYFFGVLDGHGGWLCADTIAKRVCDYYMTTQVPPEEIRNYLTYNASSQVSGKTFAPRLLPYRSRNLFNDKITGDHTTHQLNVFNEIWPMWRDSLHKFAYDIAHKEITISNDREALYQAIKRLDRDILEEGYRYGSREVSSVWGNLSKDIRSFFRNTAKSGAVGTFCMIKQGMLTMAHLGDTRAILGRKVVKPGSMEPEWVADKISMEHNGVHVHERAFIRANHPEDEHETCIIDDRVLGILQPTRAFGNARLKAGRSQLAQMFKDDEDFQCYHNYHTPPYVSNEPLVNSIVLSPDVKFMVIASDGFWEKFEPYFCGAEAVFETEETTQEERDQKNSTNEQGIIEMIGFHLDALDILQNMEGEYEKAQFKALHGLENNVATNAIKRCLMVNEFGDPHKLNLAETLTLRPAERRMRRDDITCTIIKF